MSTSSPFPWPFRTLSDAYAPRPPIAWAVQGLFEVPSLSIVYGAPGCLKSMLLADMACCVAAGLPWLEPIPHTGNVVKGLPTQSGPVLWLDFDNGERRTDDRFAAIGRARQLVSTTPIYYASMPSPWLAMDKPKHKDALQATVTSFGARLVVIDNLGVIIGDADEISAEIGKVMSALRQVALQAPAAFVVIHHQRKGNGARARDGESLRGHSSIEAALDLALLVERKPDAASVKLRSTKTRGPDVAERAAIFTFQHRAGTSDLEQARFYGMDAPKNGPSADDLERAILDTLETTALNQSKIVEAVSKQEKLWTRQVIRDALSSMEARGLIRSVIGPRKSLVYSVV